MKTFPDLLKMLWKPLGVHILQFNNCCSRIIMILSLFHLSTTFVNLKIIFLGLVDIKCHLCKECFSCISTFINHQKRHKKKNNVNFQYLCNSCSYSSPYPGYMKTHLMRHYGVKPFKCQVCGSSYVSKAQLSQHHLLSHLSVE